MGTKKPALGRLYVLLGDWLLLWQLIFSTMAKSYIYAQIKKFSCIPNFAALDFHGAFSNPLIALCKQAQLCNVFSRLQFNDLRRLGFWWLGHLYEFRNRGSGETHMISES